MITAACGGVSGPARSSPPPVPAVGVEAPGGPAPPAPHALLPAPSPADAYTFDPILTSRVARDPEFRARVRHWLEVFRTRESAWFPEYLKRMRWFVDSVDSALEAKALPRSLRFLPIVESGYSPEAVSGARAVGLWQFMAPTARGLGLRVTPLFDQRRDPFRSTAAATVFLKDLRGRFGSWFLALAAYNAGPGRIRRILDRHAPGAEPTDSLYWALRAYLPRETRDFLPKLFAAAEVARRPEAYGFSVSDRGAEFAFDEVSVPDATTLDVVSLAAEAPQEEIERLNPEIVRGITPPGERVVLRVPAGAAGRFRMNYARIPPGSRVTFVEHRVRSGETLGHIALRYRVPLDELRAANPGVRPRFLQIGQRLTVPIAPRARR